MRMKYGIYYHGIPLLVPSEASLNLIASTKNMAREINFTLHGEETWALKQVLQHLKDIRNITRIERSDGSGI